MKLSSKQVQQKLDTAAKLGSLSLANAGLSKLPPALWELHKVGCMVFTRLFVWCNSHELTVHVSGVQLRVLDVSFNKLPALPSDLCSLARLVKLQLGNNKLTALPDLDKLTKLTTVMRVLGCCAELSCFVLLTCFAHHALVAIASLS